MRENWTTPPRRSMRWARLRRSIPVSMSPAPCSRAPPAIRHTKIVALQRAIALAPQWPRAHIAMAKALSRAGRHADAVAAANTAVELAPQELTTLEIAIAIANAAGDETTALRHLQRAHALQPADPAIGVALGVALGKQARYGEAEGHWRRRARRQSGRPFRAGVARHVPDRARPQGRSPCGAGARRGATARQPDAAVLPRARPRRNAAHAARRADPGALRRICGPLRRRSSSAD